MTPETPFSPFFLPGRIARGSCPRVPRMPGMGFLPVSGGGYQKRKRSDGGDGDKPGDEVQHDARRGSDVQVLEPDIVEVPFLIGNGRRRNGRRESRDSVSCGGDDESTVLEAGGGH